MSVFILSLANSKQSQESNCIHFEDDLTKINFFLKKFLAVLEAEISLVEGVSILICKVVVAVLMMKFAYCI